MAAPTATRTKVRYRLMDISATNPLLVDATTLDEAIAMAVTHYSNDRPRADVVEDVTGNGTAYYTLVGASPVLPSWTDGFSRVATVDYPAGTVDADYHPSWLDPDTDWRYYRDETKAYLYLPNHAPAVSETLRITYTARHTHTSVTDTVPSGDLDALCDLAAGYACTMLATKAAGTQDSVIAADSTNYRDAQLRYSQQAKAWFDAYSRQLGLTMGTAPASALTDWTRPGSTGYPMLTHSRRWR
jgi:hypothetical protein